MLTIVGDGDEFEDGPHFGVGGGAGGDFGELAGEFLFGAGGDDEAAWEEVGVIGGLLFADGAEEVSHTFFFDEEFHVPWTLFVHDVEEVVTGANGSVFEHLSELRIGDSTGSRCEDIEFFGFSIFEGIELIQCDDSISLESGEFDEESLSVCFGGASGFGVTGSGLGADDVNFLGFGLDEIFLFFEVSAGFFDLAVEFVILEGEEELSFFDEGIFVDAESIAGNLSIPCGEDGMLFDGSEEAFCGDWVINFDEGHSGDDCGGDGDYGEGDHEFSAAEPFECFADGGPESESEDAAMES